MAMAMDVPAKPPWLGYQQKVLGILSCHTRLPFSPAKSKLSNLGTGITAFRIRNTSIRHNASLVTHRTFSPSKWTLYERLHHSVNRSYDNDGYGTEEGTDASRDDDDSNLVIEAAGNKGFSASEFFEPEGLVVVMSCAVGLMTGAGVVLFNLGVHELHDIVWHGIPNYGESWLRNRLIDKHWIQVLLVPTGGGVVVALLNLLRGSWDKVETNTSFLSSKKDNLKVKLVTGMNYIVNPVLKTMAALVTLGTGNSLGPEGPSVEVGASIANLVGTIFKSSRERKQSLIAAGSAAGISSGFNAAISGCFFAVESVLRPLSPDSAPSLTTAMVLLSSVLASVISQAGLGTDPAFKIPAYDFRSPAELPLYLMLGILCGLVSVGLTKCSSYTTYIFQKIKEWTNIPDVLFPPFGGLCVGLIALIYPGVLYWGFENVDILLESRPLQRSPPAMLLLQLVGVKIVATSICRGSGLVGGFYAPSLFIGAALGSAYGKLVSYAVNHADPLYHLDVLKVAVPQAYALVGMAATLAGVCQVPLTSVLLLFELTRDYRIILPLMGAVGVSSWVASALTKIQQQPKATPLKDQVQLRNVSDEQNEKLKTNKKYLPSESASPFEVSGNGGLCVVDSSLCIANEAIDEESLLSEILVADAMRTSFAKVYTNTSVEEALDILLTTKEWCLLIIEDNNILKGLVTFSDIQQQARKINEDFNIKAGLSTVSEICNSWVSEDVDFPVITVYPDMSLQAAWRLMSGRGLRQLPVISREIYLKDKVKVVEGIVDRESIQLACRAEATKKLLRMSSISIEREK